MMLSTCNKDNGFLCIIDNSTILFKTYAQQKPKKSTLKIETTFSDFLLRMQAKESLPPSQSLKKRLLAGRKKGNWKRKKDDRKCCKTYTGQRHSVSFFTILRHV